MGLTQWGVLDTLVNSLPLDIVSAQIVMGKYYKLFSTIERQRVTTGHKLIESYAHRVPGDKSKRLVILLFLALSGRVRHRALRVR